MKWLERFIIVLLEFLKKGHESNSDDLPVEGDGKENITLMLVVGHTRTSPGAKFNGSEYKSEYDYNKALTYRIEKFAPKYNIDIKVQYRDGIGIVGAYEQVRAEDPQACIELHFNAFDGKASGTETLCTSAQDDKAFAHFVQENVCMALGRMGSSRGVKVLSKGSRGHLNVYSAGKVPNCLIEPFFGDNAKEASLAVEKMDDYAQAILRATREWFDS